MVSDVQIPTIIEPEEKYRVLMSLEPLSRMSNFYKFCLRVRTIDLD